LSKIEKIDQNSTKTTTNFLYDENGNLLKDASHEYIYDKKARLVGVDNNVSYAYNHENTRVSKTVNAKTTHFIYDGSKLIGEYNSDGSVKNEYIYLNGTPLAVTNATQTLYIHTDHLGTPRRLADENGAIVWSWESEPFGESKAVGIVEFNFRFAGQYFDDETSTHYNINRDYDPKTGRYLQSDPIGFDGGVNSYGYVSGNPLGAVDEMGLKKLSWFPSDTEVNKWFREKAVPNKPDKKDWCLVYTHGGGGTKLLYTNGIYYDKASDIKILLIKAGCNEKMPIRLYACRTGRGISSMAAKLSLIWKGKVSAPWHRLLYTVNNKLDGTEPRHTVDDDGHTLPYADYFTYINGKETGGVRIYE